MSITFFAYHGNSDLRDATLDSVASRFSAFRDSMEKHDERDQSGFISAIAGGKFDVEAAHRNSGFPAPLLFAAEAIFDGLPAEDAPRFALDLMKTATINTDLADVALAFAEWMFADAVATNGPSRMRASAKNAGSMFKAIAESKGHPYGEQHKSKAHAKKLKRRGHDSPSAQAGLVALAVSALVDSGMQHVGTAIKWSAEISGQPSEQYQCYARKLCNLVEAS
ncbi:MAG: hypothetical protein EAZ43_10580 [Betaproteobacteria bacterium]|nr:MAG: hypothetical protein EAZ43_10580 [Betaproteobacteria bacterium]